MKKRRGVDEVSGSHPFRKDAEWMGHKATRPEACPFSGDAAASQMVRIEKPIYGGAFLARMEGKAVFVPLALPGEEARIRIVDGKRGYATAEVEEIVTASPQRVVPACPYFGACGGCQYQHANYAAQLAYKQEILRETLERGGVRAPETIEVLAAEPWAYRNRIRLAFDAAWKCGIPRAPFARRHSYRRVPYRGAAAGADSPCGRQDVAGIAGQFARERDFPLLRCRGDSAARECHGCRGRKTRL